MAFARLYFARLAFARLGAQLWQGWGPGAAPPGGCSSWLGEGCGLGPDRPAAIFAATRPPDLQAAIKTVLLICLTPATIMRCGQHSIRISSGLRFMCLCDDYRVSSAVQLCLSNGNIAHGSVAYSRQTREAFRQQGSLPCCNGEHACMMSMRRSALPSIAGRPLEEGCLCNKLWQARLVQKLNPKT